MLQIISHTIHGEFTLNAVAWTAHTCTLRITALNHKTGNNSVKNQAIIKAFLNEGNKVIHCIRSNFRV